MPVMPGLRRAHGGVPTPSDHSMPPTKLLRACSLLLPTALVAQAPSATLRGTEPGVGLQAEADGSLVGLGTQYKAAFGAAGLEFTPMLGSGVPENQPFAWQLAAVGRGDVEPVMPGRRCHGELVVEFVRPACTERYELRPEGIEQSFHFPSLPPGQGDLVVRGRITTGLLPTEVEGGLEFTLPGLGGVSVHGVLGIDAAGRTVQGSMRMVGGQLEYRLPAEFVDAAQLPLVVDPLITPLVVIDNTANDDRDPDVTYVGSGFTKHLLVWRRIFSATDADLTARFLDNGTLGPLLGIESALPNADAGRVTTVTNANTCVVVWHQAGDIFARGVAGAGTLTPAVPVATTAGSEIAPDIGGGLSTGSRRSVCVWRNTTSNSLQAAQIEVTTTTPPTLTVGAPLTVVAGSQFVTVGAPTIARASAASFWLVAYTETSTLTSLRSVRGVVLTSTPTIAQAPFSIAVGSASSAVGNPEVDGDGNHWVVAYEIDSSLLADINVACVGVTWSTTALTVALTAARVVGATSSDQRNPSVAWLGNSCLITYTQANGAHFDVRLASIDPFTCLDCEGAFVVDALGNDAVARVAGDFVGDPTSDEAAILWVPIGGVPAHGNLNLTFFDAIDGTRTSLGSGCLAGVVHATCARPANTDFAFQLALAPTAQPAFLLLGWQQVALPCGGCTFYVDPFESIVVPAGTTSATGGARVPCPLPNDPALSGRSLVAQFALPGGACIGMGVTGAIRVTIE